MNSINAKLVQRSFKLNVTLKLTKEYTLQKDQLMTVKFAIRNM